MELWLVVVAFGFGFLANAVRLPPMVGYLIAGFALRAAGQESSESVDVIADLGILVLLFGIGLKLKLRSLARPVVWGGASLHLVLTSLVIGSALFGLGALGLPLAKELERTDALLLGFAFSFSSTVFAVKALQERNESGSLQGVLAISMLVVQDIFAVAFLTLAVDEPPSIWALPVLAAMLLARPLYGWVLDRSGNGELLLLLGLALAVGVGAEAFDRVGIKPDLGALIMGLTLASHPRASELAAVLLDFKDVLLIGFFLSIGLRGLPSWPELLVGFVVLALLPAKTAGFVAIITAFGFRARTAWHTSLSLASYSEFGLIIALVGVERAMIGERWTATIAVAVAVSFALAAPLNTARYSLYARLQPSLARFERKEVQPDDALIEPGGANVIVFGMGRVGAGAYDELVERRGEVVLGVDRTAETVAANCDHGRSVVRGDALDLEFWGRLRLDRRIDLVVLAMSDHDANLVAVKSVRRFLPEVRIAATATFDNEVAELGHAGVDVARNLYGEAGQGLADDACDLLGTTDSTSADEPPRNG